MAAVLSAALALGLTATTSGCTPPCGRVCRKVLYDCELDSQRVAVDECELACTQQLELYRTWQDEELLDLFDDHRRCVMRASCDELAAGECYEGYESLFVFDLDKDLDALVPPTSPTDGTGDTASP